MPKWSIGKSVSHSIIEKRGRKVHSRTGFARGETPAMVSTMRFWMKSGEGRWYIPHSIPDTIPAATCLGSKALPPMKFENLEHSIGLLFSSSSKPGVFVSGGYPTCTVTPKPRSSLRRVSPSPRIAHLVGEYVEYPIKETTAAPDATNTICPDRRSHIPGAAALARCTAERKFCDIDFSNTFASCCMKYPGTEAPALAIATSSGPAISSAFWTALTVAAASERSTATKLIFCPGFVAFFLIVSTAALSVASVRARMVT
mmetsp:Transcript_9104/g.22436  ORF Transcript_9104/g.22436 Transcript_9104/m.22436 type:complete len:258 (+) Transcript_9104:297-1070(+)